jgi:hypothetical protein
VLSQSLLVEDSTAAGNSCACDRHREFRGNFKAAGSPVQWN